MVPSVDASAKRLGEIFCLCGCGATDHCCIRFSKARAARAAIVVVRLRLRSLRTLTIGSSDHGRRDFGVAQVDWLALITVSAALPEGSIVQQSVRAITGRICGESGRESMIGINQHRWSSTQSRVFELIVRGH